jgi:hypothetical protein
MERPRFDPGEFQRTMERLKEGTDHGAMEARPHFDHKQDLEFREESKHGRRVGDFIQALERAGFKFWPKGAIPPGCEGNGTIFDPPRPLAEGQWRRPPDRALPRALGMTDDQVAAWFSSPEEFWQWIQTLKMTKQQKTANRGNAPSLKILSQVPSNFR